MSKPKVIDIWYKIDLKLLWWLEILTEDLKIVELENNLDIYYFEKEGTDDWNLTPRQLIQNYNIEISHKKKIIDADLKYPIEIYNNKWKRIILDWVHRYVKSIQLWKNIIKVRKVTNKDLDMINNKKIPN